MRKITSFLLAFVFVICAYAQQPAINSLEIGGRALKGTDEFGNSKPFTKVGDGVFVYYGYFYYTNPLKSSGNQGFKISVNRHIAASTQWNNSDYTALVPAVDGTTVSNGNNYAAMYSGSQKDFKWRLIVDGDNWYKITMYTSDLSNVNFDFDIAEGTFADLASFNVAEEGAVLTPVFDPEVTEYTCTLMKGSTTATPVVGAHFNTLVSGTDVVDVSSGTGISTIVVTSLDKTTTKTYTINYFIASDGPENLTNLIVNNDFDYVASGVAFSDTDNYPTYGDGSSSNISGAWRPLKSGVTTIGNHLYFYGWELSNWEFLFKDSEGNFIKVDETSPNQSIGINAGVSSTHGTGAWINGDFKCLMPNDFEFYQLIDKNNLAAGTYKLSALMGIQSGVLTSQRLFANNNVQYFGKEADYEQNKTEGEVSSYAGYSTSGSGDTHEEMKVYVTISNEESLKIGVRSGNKRGDGSEGVGTGGNLLGWFKMDYFRLIKLLPADAANARLANITVSTGTLDFSPETTVYDVVLPVGTESVTVQAVADLEDAAVTGTGVVDVASSGEGVSTIVVTALDGTTTKTYTINYLVDLGTNINDVNVAATYLVTDRKLSVKGADAYSVYGVNGAKVANVKANMYNTTIDLLPGVYIVKTNNAGVFKVLVK